jgi:mannose-1-phosphate guanylyltransferase
MFGSSSNQGEENSHVHKLSTSETDNRVAIVLAGGEGTRLRSLTTKITGAPIPKQFCPLMGDLSLFQQTVRRVGLSFAQDRIITVVNRQHESFYDSQLPKMPASQLLVQPGGRGTASAIIYALFRALQFGRDTCVAVFPSDHYVDNDPLFMRHVEHALDVIDRRPELTVLLGSVPERPESSYGWIEPGERIPHHESEVFGVRGFWEKPSLPFVQKLMSANALWNTLVFASRVSSLLGLFLAVEPKLYASFASLGKCFGTAAEPRKIQELYAQIDSIDFSSSVLSRSPRKLAVLKVGGIKWSDLGEPARVLETIRQTGSRPLWTMVLNDSCSPGAEGLGGGLTER